MSARIESLLERMTWEQKLMQLQILWRPDTAEREALIRRGMGSTFWPPSATETNEMQRIAVDETPLGIPLLVALDVLHGQFTIFPTPLAQAASFDPEVAASDARVSAAEARANGVNWTFSPMVDVVRDARWGRVVESFGEDVHLASTVTAAKVAAYQDQEQAGADGIAACLKHFVAYGAAEAGRDYNTTDLSDRTLRETYLETFRIGVAQGAASVMASFNSLNGHPMHANRALLTGVLKDEWDFDGAIVGDADGVASLIDHGVAIDERAAIALAFEAGIDVVMGGSPLVGADGAAAISPAEVSAERIDDAVRRVLRLTPVSESLADALRAELPDVHWDVADGAGFFEMTDAALAGIVERAAAADLVVIAAGEPSRISGEASSRADISLPEAQRRLIRALAGAGARIVVVLVTGRPLVVEDWGDRVDALLCVWHLGVEAPAAIAATLSGRVNPGGRVPMTFPRAVGQVPIHYDHERTARPPRTGGALLPETIADFTGPNNTDDYYTSKYLDLPLGPRFDFGHGLSYTTFELDRLTLTHKAITADDLTFWGETGERLLEPGDFTITVGDGTSELRTGLCLEES